MPILPRALPKCKPKGTADVMGDLKGLSVVSVICDTRKEIWIGGFDDEEKDTYG